MRQFYTSIQMLQFISEYNNNIGYLIGITEITNSDKNWSLMLYIGNGKLLSLYSKSDGINESAFEEILNMDNIYKEALKKKNWQSENVKEFDQFSENCFDFICYEFNIIDISIEKKVDAKNLISTIKSNLSQVHQLEEGDVIIFERGFYTHHAILADTSYMTVIHKWGEPEESTSFGIASKSIIGIPTEKACVSEDFVIEVAGYRPLSKGNDIYDSKHKPKEKDEILKECRARLGEIGYSVLGDNCHHFVSKNRNGIARSPEIESVQDTLKKFAIFSVSAVSAMFVFNKMKGKEKRNSLE